MTPTFIISVHGTWGLDSPETDWWKNASEFKRVARENNILEYNPQRLFFWDGEVEGATFGSKKEGWRAGAFSLDSYLLSIPKADRNLILHSHAWNVWLHGNVEVRNIITVGSPMRSDMFNLMEFREKDRANHLHIFDKNWDRWGLLGQLGDGRFSLSRKCPVNSTINHELEDISHSKILNDSEYIKLWVTRGWFDFLRK